MKNLYWKDKNRRTSYLRIEKTQQILNYILNNLNLNSKIRENAFEELININEIWSKTKIHNRCVLTNRSRGIYKKFKISRLLFKRNALEGVLMGVRKASW